MLPLISRILTGQDLYSRPWLFDLRDNNEMAAIGFHDEVVCPPTPTMICPPPPKCPTCDQNWEEWMKTEKAIIGIAVTIAWFIIQIVLRRVQRALIRKGMRVAHPAERALSFISGIPVRIEEVPATQMGLDLPRPPPSYRTEDPKPPETPYYLDSVSF